MVKGADCHKLRQFTVLQQFKQQSQQNLVEFYSLAEFGRIWQNSIAQQNLVEFYSLAEFGRILQPNRVQQNLTEFHSLIEFGRIQQIWQIAVNYSKLRSYTWSLLAELVGTGNKVLLVCFIILYLIALVVYRQQP